MHENQVSLKEFVNENCWLTASSQSKYKLGRIYMENTH